MNENVGTIEYDAVIRTDKFKQNSKDLENQANKTGNSVDRSFSNAGRNASQSIDGLSSSLRGLVGQAVATAAGAVSLGAAFQSTVGAAFDQVRQVENATFAFRAYEKNAGAVNQVLGELIQYARSDLGVLFQREELFQAASTLKGFGESTANLTDRVKILSQGVSIGSTTFAELSQIIGRSAQQGKLTAEAYDQLAYRGIILNSSLRGAAVGADELYQALDSAIDDSILEGRANTIDGQLTRLQSSFRDLGSTILGVDRSTSQFVQGGLGDSIVDFIATLTTFVNVNKQAIATAITTTVAFAGIAGGAYTAYKGLQVLMKGLILFSKSPVVATFVLLFGIFSSKVVGEYIENTQSAADSTEGLGGALDTTTNQMAATSDEAGKLAKQIQNIDDQILKAKRDFQEQLAEIVKGHQDTVKELTGQLEEENKEYQAAYRQRLYEFQEQQGKEEQTHQDKTARLRAQIDFLRRYNNASNRQQLADLQFALARENSEYTKRFGERQQKYDADAAYEKLKADQRTLELQTRLNQENAILTKHAGDVASIRDVQLLDEIDKLKRSRDEQLASLNQQKMDAINNANQTAAGVGSAYNALGNTTKNNLIETGKAAGAGMGKSFMDSLKKAINDAWGQFWQDVYDASIFSEKGRESLKGSQQQIQQAFKDIGKKRVGGGWATGGFTGRGGVNEIAGAVHRGEYVLPQSMVNQSTGMPDLSALDSELGSRGSASNVTVNISMSGIMTSSPSDERAIAKRFIDRVNEELRSKGKAELAV